MNLQLLTICKKKKKRGELNDYLLMRIKFWLFICVRESMCVFK